MAGTSSREPDFQPNLPGIRRSGSKNSKKKRSVSQPVFKPYQQDQMLLLPPSLEELIPPNHLVRVINETVERLDIEPLLKTYKGGGTSSYHPLMLLKVLLYAYVEGIYSSRKIAKALRENVHFMWLSGMQRPDFRTLNSFRSGRLKEHIDTIFASLLLFLVEAGYVDLESYFVDGSKFMANAHRYSYVWKKNVTRYRKSVLERIEQLLAEIERVNEQENRRYGDEDLEELGDRGSVDEGKRDSLVRELNEELGQPRKPPDEPVKEEQEPSPGSDGLRHSEEISGRVEQLEKQLEEQQADGTCQKKRRLLMQVKEKLLPRLRRYEAQAQQLGKRGSYSRTDPDATFMRFKGDVLAAGYNILMGCQNQFILNFSVHQNAADSACFIAHMEKFRALSAKLPGNAVGDAGFGNEENYRYLHRHGIGNYLKYNQFHQEKKQKQKVPYSKSNFTYDRQWDVFICPEGQELVFEEEQLKETATGYLRRIRRYRTRSCGGCPARRQCCKGEAARSVEFSPLFETFKKQARCNLESAKGQELRRRRGVEIETILGQLKFNKKYSRFLLRGLEKVNIELGLLSIAHNLEKMFNHQKQYTVT